jgi:putative flippase GtrA
MASLTDRLLSRNTAKLLGRDASASSVTFAVGISLMWIFVEFAKMDETVAAAVSFAAGNSLHYAAARLWIFRGTTRGLAKGYGYFIANAAVGLLIMVLIFAALTAWTAIHYLVARALASIVAGLIIFLLNAVFNFRRV